MRNYLFLLLIWAYSGLVGATVIQPQYGDDDGLGLGLTEGESFYWADLPRTGADLTDIWLRGDINLDLNYDLGGMSSVTSASLLIGTGGQGWMGPTSLYIDGSLVGQLTDGDDGGNFYRRDSFDLTPYLALLDGANSFFIDLVGDGDGWSLDFLQLTLSDDPGVSVGPLVVPTPAAAMLFCSALAGLVCIRRR